MLASLGMYDRYLCMFTLVHLNSYGQYMIQWGVPNTKCCFNCIAGNVIYGHPNSENIVVVRILIFHQDPFFGGETIAVSL